MAVFFCLNLGVIGFTWARFQYATQIYTEKAANYNVQVGAGANWRDDVFKSILTNGWAGSGIFGSMKTLVDGGNTTYEFKYIDSTSGAINATPNPGDYFLTTVRLNYPPLSPAAWVGLGVNPKLKAVGIARIE
jgi:hypothetical protein